MSPARQEPHHEDAQRAERRKAILEAAREVFLRYGFKKTAMDDIAKAAGLSRQGLYLHFPTKDALFGDMVQRTLAEFRAAARERLSCHADPLEARLLDSLVIIHGSAVGSNVLTELIEAGARLAGHVTRQFEAEVAADIAAAIATSDVVRRWRDINLDADALAEHLIQVSVGVKHQARDPADYRRRMMAAIRLVCRSDRADFRT